MKVIAIASVGGHWVELMRLRKAFDQMEVVYISTRESLSLSVPDNKFYTIPNSSRWEKLKVIQSFWKIFKIIKLEKPEFVISTGAAPGLLGILAGKMLGLTTIWVDSIANVEELSLSGKIAIKFADRIYTQWPDLAKDDIVYAGNILV